MMRSQISIAALMGLVLMCACGLAALRYPLPILADVFTGVTVFALLTATLGAIKGRSRAAWLGFAVFGWGFAALSWACAMHEAVSNEPARGHGFPTTMSVPLTPLTRWLDSPYLVMHQWSDGTYTSFQWIGHALACLLVGLIGSGLGVVWDLANQRPENTRITVADLPGSSTASSLPSIRPDEGP